MALHLKMQSQNLHVSKVQQNHLKNHNRPQTQLFSVTFTHSGKTDTQCISTVAEGMEEEKILQGGVGEGGAVQDLQQEASDMVLKA